MLTIERMQTAPGFGKSTGAARAAGHRSKGAPRGHGRPGSGETEPNGRFRDYTARPITLEWAEVPTRRSADTGPLHMRGP